MNNIEICLSPKLFNQYNVDNKIVVVVDILRATTIITTIIANGAQQVIPVKDLDQAIEYKKKGFLVVAERDGKKLNFADFGNSPFEFVPDRIKNKTLVYSSTNGTNTIHLAKNANQVIIASFLNLTSVSEYLTSQNRDILILCSGWMGDFCLEDFLFAGALAERLIETNTFNHESDKVISVLEQWNLAKSDLMHYITKLSQYKRLLKFGFKRIVEYCFNIDVNRVVPVLRGEVIIKI